MDLRALIVDDSPHFLVAARGVLEREGITVVGVASTSEEAVRLAQGLQPDVALVDINLGEESGFDLARRLLEPGHHEPTQAVLISSYPEGDYADLIAESPALGFLAKPDLSARRIREILAAHEPPQSRRTHIAG